MKTAIGASSAADKYAHELTATVGSIIIVTFNCSRTVREYLHSLNQQRFRDFEVIVVDNGSADGRTEVIASIEPELAYPLKILP